MKSLQGWVQSVVQEIKDKTSSTKQDLKIEHDRYVLPSDFHEQVVGKEAMLDIQKYSSHTEFT
jgi:hypothetical protein